MPPKRGARGGAVKRTAPVKATPEKKEEVVKEEVKEEEEEVKDEEVKEEAAAEEENGEEEYAEGEGEEGGEEEAAAEAENGEEPAEGEGEKKTEEKDEKKTEEKDEKKEGDAKEVKKEAKKRPRFNPHNRTVAVHEYHIDRMSNVHDRTVMIGPTNLDDLQNEKLISYLTNNAVQFFIRYACKPEVKGHVEIRFKTATEAEEAAEDLQTIREGLIANQNNEEFQGSDKAKELKNLWGTHDEGSSAQRTLVLKGLPKDVTLEQLEEKIPDATQIIMPRRGSPSFFPGFCYVEFPTAELVEKMLKNEEKMKFPDPENSEEEKETVYKKFDNIPHSDLLIKKIDTQHFEKSFMAIPGDVKQEMLNQFIQACSYFERNSFLLRPKRLETIKKKKQMLLQRRDEVKKMTRAQNRKGRGGMNRNRPTGGRGGAMGVSPGAGRGGGGGGGGGGGRGGRVERGGGAGAGGNRFNDRRPMKRFNDRSPRGDNMGGKRMRRDSWGRGDDRGPMPSGPRIPRDAWQSNNWNSGGGMGSGNYNSYNSGMGNMGGSMGGSMGSVGGGGSGYGGGMNRGSNMDMGGYGNVSGNTGRMDTYNSGNDYYDEGSMRNTMGGGNSMGGGAGTGGNYGAAFSTGMNDYDDMGNDNYGSSYGGGVSSGGGGGGGGGYNDGYDSYSTSAAQSRKSSLNPQQAANAVNLLVGLSSLMGTKVKSSSSDPSNKNQSGSTGGRYGGSTGGQKGGRWGGGRN